jgi:hypothetical protein
MGPPRNAAVRDAIIDGKTACVRCTECCRRSAVVAECRKHRQPIGEELVGSNMALKRAAKATASSDFAAVEQLYGDVGADPCYAAFQFGVDGNAAGAPCRSGRFPDRGRELSGC